MKKLLFPLLALCVITASAQVDATRTQSNQRPQVSAEPSPKRVVRQRSRAQQPQPAVSPQPGVKPAKRPFFERLFENWGKPKPRRGALPSPTPGVSPASSPQPRPTKRRVKPAPAVSPTPEETTRPKPTPTPKPDRVKETPTPTPAPPRKESPTPTATPAKAAGDSGSQDRAIKPGKLKVTKPVEATAVKPAPPVDDPVRYREARTKALADAKVLELQQKMDNATDDDAHRRASREYYKSLFDTMRKIDPSIKERVDRTEAATLKRVEGKP